MTLNQRITALLVIWVALGSVNCPAAEDRLPITSLVISPDGRQLVVCAENQLRIHNWAGLQLVSENAVPLHKIHHAAFSPTGNSLLLVGGTPAESGSILVLSWPELKVMWTRQVSEDILYCASFVDTADSGGDSPLVVVAGHDCSVYVLPLNSDAPPISLVSHSRPVTTVAVIESSRLILTGSMDETIRIWQLSSALLMRTLPNHLKSVRMISVRPAGGKGLPMAASVGDDRTVRLWQPTIGRMVRFKRLNSPPTTVTWTASGQSIITGCRDGSVHRINPETLQEKMLRPPGEAWINALVSHRSEQSVVVGDSDGRVLKLSIPQ